VNKGRAAPADRVVDKLKFPLLAPCLMGSLPAWEGECYINQVKTLTVMKTEACCCPANVLCARIFWREEMALLE
jgi:hypothetical protein